MKKIIFLSFAFLLILSSFALANNGWESYQSDAFTSGKANPNYYNQYSAGLPTENTLSYGDGFQPIVNDFDNDGNRELIQPEGNYLQVFTANSGVLSLDYELNIGFNVDTAMWSGDINGSSTEEIVIIYDDTFHTYTYNGINLTDEFSFDTNGTIVSGVTCANNAGNYLCYALGTGSQLFIYDPETGTGSNQTIGTYVFSNNGERDKMGNPVIDVDGNGNIDLVAVYESGSDDGIVVIDLVDFSVLWNKLYSTAGESFVRGVIAKSIDTTSGGDSEVCVTYNIYDVATYYNRDANIICYNGDGTTFDSTNWNNPSSTSYQMISPPIHANVDDDGFDDLCYMVYESGSNPKHRLNCVGTNTGAFVSIMTSSFCSSGCNHNVVIDNGLVSRTGSFTNLAAGLLTDVNIDTISSTIIYLNDLVYGDYIFYWNDSASGDTSYIDLSTSLSAVRQSILADLDNDGALDIVYGQSGSLTLMSSSISNEIPTLNNSLTNGGFGVSLNLGAPICLNTTVSFTSQETGGTAAGNYENDYATDDERIVTNCGQNAAYTAGSAYDTDLVNGTYNAANPSYSCYYNATGTYSVRLYLQDSLNDLDYTQYNTNAYTVNVVDGDAGVTCNLGSGTAIASSVDSSNDPNNVDASVTGLFDLLFGTSPFLKLVVGLSVVIATMILTATKLGANASFGAMAATGMMALAIVTFLGLIPLWVLILLVICMLITIIFANTVFSGGQGA